MIDSYTNIKLHIKMKYKFIKDMKKILFILFMIFSIIGCNNSNTKNFNENIDELDYEIVDYWKNIDTITYPYSGLCFQVLNNNDKTNSCLATVGYQRNQKENFGNTVCVITKDILYDNKYFDGDYIKVGTYKYLGNDTLYHTVLIIVNKNDYNYLFKKD